MAFASRMMPPPIVPMAAPPATAMNDGFCPSSESAPEPKIARTQELPAQVDLNTAEEFDFTVYPKMLESNMDKFGFGDCPLRPTKIKLDSPWTLKSYDRILKKYNIALYSESASKTQAKKKTMDLLDALTRSGEIAVDDCGVHVMYAATHCFDKSVFDTVVRDNINPIERIEQSALVMAHTIHGADVPSLIVDHEKGRIQMFSPSLFP